MSLAFIAGAVSSAVSGYLGMRVAVEANVRTATAANFSLSRAFKLSFNAGAVLGLCHGWYGNHWNELDLVVDWYLLKRYLGSVSELRLWLCWQKAGGGIYTKTADIAADLVGKIEIGIPEDDPRNPAVVADNVGDNVGDVAGMGADIFDSYVASAVAVMLLGASMD